MKILVVVDMQNDFISGTLGSSAAEAIVPAVKKKIEGFNGKVIFTRDTHTADYLTTQEGRNLPVEHCIKDTAGWQICDELVPFAGDNVYDKISFGSMGLPGVLADMNENIDEIVLCGLCTDICVISNAMILKAAFPEIKITVDAACCAGVSEESHNTALSAMKAVQINIINE